MEIDTFLFCSSEEERLGQCELASLTRLVADCASDKGVLSWRLVGKAKGKMERPTLLLQVQGEVGLLCQRCMTPYTFSLQSSTELIVAQNEEEADELDRLLQKEAVEVILASASLNMLDLVEDEALMALPLSPKHKECVSAWTLPEEESGSRPFDVLNKLRQSH